jgi:hypothetical protein
MLRPKTSSVPRRLLPDYKNYNGTYIRVDTGPNHGMKEPRFAQWVGWKFVAVATRERNVLTRFASSPPRDA